VTSDQLVTCFDRWEWPEMVAVVRKEVLWRVEDGRVADAEDEDGKAVAGET
jgi:hypothetical protein